MKSVEILDVRVIEPRLKHPTIFNKLEQLGADQAFVILNDHDPKPLYYQLMAEKPGQFTWQYLQEGPDEWKVLIGSNIASDTPEVLDVRIIEPRHKHPTIFNKVDALKPGESFILLNDHDPVPLYYQLMAERPGKFTWEYLEKGPEDWRVLIGSGSNTSKEETIGKMAAKDYRKAMVFKKFGLDFCCGGKKTLDEAAKEKGINKEAIQNELDALDKEEDLSSVDFTSWDAGKLIDYIVSRHHEYVKTRLPEIMPILHKVLDVHSDSHPELNNIHQLFHNIADELTDHLTKEENVLFPYIKALTVENKYKPQNFTVKMSIPIMEDEHSAVAKNFEILNIITNSYTPPAGACGSYKLLFGLLSEFEEDLKQHVHLENNVLFPKAIEIENSILNG